MSLPTLRNRNELGGAILVGLVWVAVVIDWLWVLMLPSMIQYSILGLIAMVSVTWRTSRSSTASKAFSSRLPSTMTRVWIMAGSRGGGMASSTSMLKVMSRSRASLCLPSRKPASTGSSIPCTSVVDGAT